MPITKSKSTGERIAFALRQAGVEDRRAGMGFERQRCDEAASGQVVGASVRLETGRLIDQEDAIMEVKSA